MPNDAGSSLAVMKEDDGGAVGTVLLSVNPEIEMYYDREGNVVALTALNDDGRSILESYTGYEGRACHSRHRRAGGQDQRRRLL